MNISLTVTIGTYQGYIYTNEDNALVGSGSSYFHLMLYFYDRIETIFYGIQQEGYGISRDLIAIGNGEADFTGNYSPMESHDSYSLNRYNAAYLNINGYEDCCLAHKATFGRAINIDLLQTVASTHSLSKVEVFIALALVLFGYLVNDFFQSNQENNSRNFICLQISTRIFHSQYFLKNVSILTFTLVLTQISFLFGAFFTTDCILLDQPKTLNNIKDLETWKYKELMSLPTGCFTRAQYAFKEKIDDYHMIGGALEVAELLEEYEPGLLLLVTPKVTMDYLYWFYCDKVVNDCSNQFIHTSDSFVTSFNTRYYRNDLEEDKVRFLWRYSYSMLENGMWTALEYKYFIKHKYTTERRLWESGSKNFEQNWTPVPFKFMIGVLYFSSFSLLFSLLILIFHDSKVTKIISF